MSLVKKRVPVHKFVSVVLAAGLLASLSACASTPLGNSAVFSSCDATGNAALVTSKGKIGADPQSTFPTPLIAKSSQAAVATKGDGKRVTSDDGVDLVLSIYNGTTGEVLQTQSGPITALTVRLFVSGGSFPFSEAMSCATVGSRVVTTGTASALFGEQALGLDPDQALVVVSDIDAAFAAKANGADQLAQAGYPSVVLAPNGRPGFTFPSSEVPDGLGSIALKQGNGATVKEGDLVIANVTGVVWDASTTFLSSWDDKAPTTVDTSSDSTEAPGLLKAVVGQKVGSQLLVVVSGDRSYASGQEPAGVVAGDTVVFVVDILGISE